MLAELFLLALAAGMPAIRLLWEAACKRWSEWTMFVVGCFLSQMLGYFLGVAPFALADALQLRAGARVKIQPGKYASVADQARALRLLLASFVAVILPMLVVGGSAIGLFGISRDRPLPSTPTLLTHLAFFLLVEDYLNYWLHRALHSPWLYKHIHSVHHEFNAPFALAAAYAHPAETVILAIPTFAGPALIAPHMFTIFVWQLLRNYEAIDIHSGYELPFGLKTLFPAYAGADHHDYHHYHHSGNFASVFIWCDRMYGTDVAYLRFRQRRDKAVAKAKAL
jgi:sterol desaturase/sphingolipid hydroxylase (fatty acid hydroxylase superfamily)